eukprot:6476640-Amphidinium_carterae.1
MSLHAERVITRRTLNHSLIRKRFKGARQGSVNISTSRVLLESTVTTASRSALGCGVLEILMDGSYLFSVSLAGAPPEAYLCKPELHGLLHRWDAPSIYRYIVTGFQLVTLYFASCGHACIVYIVKLSSYTHICHHGSGWNPSMMWSTGKSLTCSRNSACGTAHLCAVRAVCAVGTVLEKWRVDHSNVTFLTIQKTCSQEDGCSSKGLKSTPKFKLLGATDRGNIMSLDCLELQTTVSTIQKQVHMQGLCFVCIHYVSSWACGESWKQANPCHCSVEHWNPQLDCLSPRSRSRFS